MHSLSTAFRLQILHLPSGSWARFPRYIYVYFALGSASSQVMLPDLETQSLFCYSMRVSVTLSQKI